LCWKHYEAKITKSRTNLGIIIRRFLETVCEGVYWIQVAHNTVRGLDFVKTNVRVDGSKEFVIS
jgi:hypothetical protein